MLAAVVFDWGGTLSQHVPVDLLDVWLATARVVAPPGRHDEVAAALVAAESAWWDRVTTEGGSGTITDLLAAASDATGVDVASALSEAGIAAHLDAWTPHVRHDPDAAPVLRALRARGLRLGLLSNTHWPRSWHESFLARDGLAELLDVEVYTSELEHVKPHPSAFAAVLSALGVDPDGAIFVGDRPYDDIFGAQRAGMRAVLRSGAPVPPYDVVPDAVIDTLPELLEVVGAWTDGRPAGR